MNLNACTHMHFLGIGGIGMSALARFFRAMGKSVSGYDKTETALTRALQQEGITVYYEESLQRIPLELKHAGAREKTVVVYTPAVPADHAEMQWFREHNYVMMKRAQVLGLIAEATRTFAIAGTHGKTTTTTLTAHLMRCAGIDCSAFLGGISGNYGTNLLLGSNLGKAEVNVNNNVVVVEADEYDRSFLWLHPVFAVITSVDADHLDIYGNAEEMYATYRKFASQIQPGGLLVTKPEVVEKLALGNAQDVATYSLSDSSCHYYASDIRIENGYYVFTLNHHHHRWEDLTLGLPGRHNVENAVAASALAIAAGANEDGVRLGLASFKGVGRRFEYRFRAEQKTYIDDYGHHPAELNAAISSARELFPGQKIMGIFQPHLFSRTRDFMQEFAQVLATLDEVLLLDIYPAREKPIDGITSAALAQLAGKNARVVSKADAVQAAVNTSCGVVLTLGAGDIDQLVQPIENALRETYTPLEP
ncbi:MAG: UDP-N-acetylmuramate--L-alanine ligase [Bacteroidia bacterium]|jgi:UDP-N-acetylmuramate--alanine ligase|nr:UDP-N-acetylmuramate--L-alanine ligase [Bacteroidia bacterium]